jgi:hypothetical protein
MAGSDQIPAPALQDGVDGHVNELKRAGVV